MRGAGNVLGAEQSGHIAGVGFDLYVRLVGEAVEAFRSLADGKVVDGADKAPKEIRVDLPVDAHIPDTYVNSERLRLEVYRALAQSTSETDLRLIVEEMEDRYGPIPVEVSRLLAVAHPVELLDSQQVRLKRLFPGATYRAAAKAIQLPFPKAGRNVTDPQLRDVDLVQWVADFIATMFDVDGVDVTGGGDRDAQAAQKRVISVGGAQVKGKPSGTSGGTSRRGRR